MEKAGKGNSGRPLVAFHVLAIEQRSDWSVALGRNRDELDSRSQRDPLRQFWRSLMIISSQ